MLPVHHPWFELEVRLATDARHAVEIAVGDELEAHRDEAVVDLPLALQFDLVDVLLRQGVLHLPESVVVEFGRVDMAADQLSGERLAQRDGAGDGAVGVVRVIDGNVDALVHRSSFHRGTLSPEPLYTLVRGGPKASVRSAWLAREARSPDGSQNSSRSGGCWLLRFTAELPAGARAVPYPADHGQLEGENEQGCLQHRADGRRDHFRLDVERIPERQTSPVATLAREPVPHREG